MNNAPLPTQQPPVGPYPPPPMQPQFQRPPYPPRHRRRRRGGFWRTSCLGCCLGNSIFVIVVLCMVSAGLLAYAANPPEVTNILILGNDARPGTEEDRIARTDTIMVLSINPRKEQVSVFSLPRDVFIQSPTFGYIRANAIVRSAELNAAGTGMDEMTASIENTFGIKIDHTVRVSFESFVDVVDALGGVDIDVPKHIVDNAYPTYDYGTMRVEFEPGEQTMNGETALIYARTRHADDDYQRAGRQQQVIESVLKKLTNPLNFYRWPGVAAAVVDNIETDMNASQMVAVLPGIALYGHSPDQIEQFVVDRDYIYYGSDGEALPNVRLIRPWLEAHME